MKEEAHGISAAGGCGQRPGDGKIARLAEKHAVFLNRGAYVADVVGAVLDALQQTRDIGILPERRHEFEDGAVLADKTDVDPAALIADPVLENSVAETEKCVPCGGAFFD